GPPPLRDPSALRPPVAVRDRRSGGDHLARAVRAGARLDVRPLPLRERDVEPARVPGLDRLRAPVLDRAPARLDAPDLLEPAGLLGDPGDPACRARRARVGADRHARPPRRGVGARRLDHDALVRASRPRPRDPGAPMRQWLSIFFVGGMIAYRGLF